MSDLATSNCVLVTYTLQPPCSPAGTPPHYIAGAAKIPLMGKVPADKRWDGKLMILTGHLAEYGGCTILYVEKAVPCSTAPTPD